MPVHSTLTNSSETKRGGIQFDTNFVRRDNVKKNIVAFFNGGCPRGWLQYTTGAARTFRFASSSIEGTGGTNDHTHSGTADAFGGTDGIKAVTGSGSKPSYGAGSSGTPITTSSSTLSAPLYKLMACYKVGSV